MEATLQTSDLKNVMAVVSRGVSTRTSISILQYVLVSATASGLTIYAHDGECQISMPVSADVEAAGSVLIDGRELMDLLKVAKGKTVKLSTILRRVWYTDDTMATESWNAIKTERIETEFYQDFNAGVKVETGPMTRKMQTLDVEDFPLWSTGIMADTPVRSLSATEFSRIVLSVLPCVSQDTHRQVLTAVVVTPSHAVATDTHRLAFLRIADCDMPSVNVPERVWEHIAKALPKKFAGEITLALSDATKTVTTNHGDDVALTSETSPLGYYVMTFEDGPTVVFQPITGTYPNWERVVPSEHTRQWTVGACELMEAASAVKMVARDNANRTRFTGNDGGFVLSGRSESKGEIEMAVNAVGSNCDGFEIAVNGEYLLAALKAIPTEAVMIRMTEAYRPMTLHGADDDLYTHVIMPMAPA